MGGARNGQNVRFAFLVQHQRVAGRGGGRTGKRGVCPRVRSLQNLPSSPRRNLSIDDAVGCRGTGEGDETDKIADFSMPADLAGCGKTRDSQRSGGFMPPQTQSGQRSGGGVNPPLHVFPQPLQGEAVAYAAVRLAVEWLLAEVTRRWMKTILPGSGTDSRKRVRPRPETSWVTTDSAADVV